MIILKRKIKIVNRFGHGSDNTIERKLGTTRTDAMMVITVNNKTKITYLSLPRDSFVQIDAKNYQGMRRN